MKSKVSFTLFLFLCSLSRFNSVVVKLFSEKVHVFPIVYGLQYGEQSGLVVGAEKRLQAVKNYSSIAIIQLRNKTAKSVSFLFVL